MRCTAQDNLYVERARRKERQMPSAVRSLSGGIFENGSMYTKQALNARDYPRRGGLLGQWMPSENCVCIHLQLSFLVLISYKMRRRFALIKQTHQTRQYSIGRQRFCFCSPAFHQNFFKRIFRGGLWKPAEHGNSFSLWCFKLLKLQQK
jgi:hypothetical protein